MKAFEEKEYIKSFEWGMWKKLYYYIQSQRRYVPILVVTMLLDAGGDALFPLLTMYAIDNFIGRGDLANFAPFVLVYMSVVVMKTLTVYIFVKIAGKLETGIVYEIRKAGFKKLQELSFSYYDNTAVGWIIARLTTDAQRIGDVLAWGVVDITWAVGLMLMVGVSMFVLNAQLALITLSVLPVVVLIASFFQKRIFASQRLVRKINSEITGALNEGITGARTTKTLIREEKNFEEFQSLTGSMRNASMRAAVLSSIFLPVVMSLASMGVGLVLWAGGVSVQTGGITLGVLAVFLAYAIHIFEPVQQIARLISEIQSAQASAERTLSLIESSPDIIDSPKVLEVYGTMEHPKKENWPPIKGDISFSHVSFAYKTGEKVLENFNLLVKEGERIALVGETGAGKSTIVNLICRFYEPTSGHIYIDGVDYRERSQLWLQSNIGYVLQTPNLFSGSVMDNIRYGKLDATDEEVVAAAKKVNAYNFIMQMEQGFNTEVGEGGSKLSAGQRQLISFARAIVGDPRLFVLDEATSSIDTETELIIQEAIDDLLKGRTSFIVAHRLSTIRLCDKILVIHDGKIAESGSHKELLRLKGHYSSLYTHQFKQEAERKWLT